MKTAYNTVYILVFTLLLSACAMMGTDNTIDTHRKQLALADAQLTAVINTASDLRVAGVLDDENYAKVDTTIKIASTSMDLAWQALGKGDIAGANSQLQTVNTLLLTIRSILQERETQ